jgi:ribosomal protein L37AE/L43A
MDAAMDQSNLTEIAQFNEKSGQVNNLFTQISHPKPGDICPDCQKGVLDYDGTLVLRCDQCGFQGENGCFT